MPKRTNLFQTVVAVIHQHLADGAPIEEPAMLTNRLTGKKREVDVVLRSKAAGHEFVIGIEATSRQRGPVSAQWVESMIGKHKNLPTDKVILVSESGFTEQARDLALKEYMVPISSEVLGDGDPTFRIVNSVRSLWPKVVNLTPNGASVLVNRPGEGVKWFRAPHDLDVLAEDGSLTSLVTVIGALIRGNWPRIIEQIELVNIAEDVDTTAVLGVGPGWTVKVGDEEQSLYVRHVDGEKTDLHRIDAISSIRSIGRSQVRNAHRSIGHDHTLRIPNLTWSRPAWISCRIRYPSRRMSSATRAVSVVGFMMMA